VKFVSERLSWKQIINWNPKQRFGFVKMEPRFFFEPNRGTKYLNHRPLINTTCKRRSSVPWLTMSKAADRSSSVKTASSLPLMAWRMADTVLTPAVWQFRPWWYADDWSGRRFFVVIDHLCYLNRQNQCSQLPPVNQSNLATRYSSDWFGQQLPHVCSVVIRTDSKGVNWVKLFCFDWDVRWKNKYYCGTWLILLYWFVLLFYCFLSAQVTGVSQKTEPVASSKDIQWSSLGVKIPCKNLKITEEFKCSANDLYRALTDKEVSTHCCLEIWV